MTNLLEEEKQYIRDNEDLIKTRRYQEFFEGIITPYSAGRSNMLTRIAEFIYCDAKVDFLPYMTEIYSSMFLYAEDLISIIIPKNIEVIGNAAFMSCSNLRNVTLNEGVTTIPLNAFSRCSSLENVTISDTVKVIESWAFENCNSLPSIILPNVESIGISAFRGCTELRKVTILSSNTIFRNGAFDNCPALKLMKCPKGSRADTYAQAHNISVEYI